MTRINRVGMRADKTKILGYTNMVRPDGTPILEPGDGFCLRKIVERYTMECPECGTAGRYDDRGDVICDDQSCAAVLTDWTDGADSLAYPDVGQWYSESTKDVAFAARGASGHPLMRTPALNPPGPVSDDRL